MACEQGTTAAVGSSLDIVRGVESGSTSWWNYDAVAEGSFTSIGSYTPSISRHWAFSNWISAEAKVALPDKGSDAWVHGRRTAPSVDQQLVCVVIAVAGARPSGGPGDVLAMVGGRTCISAGWTETVLSRSLNSRRPEWGSAMSRAVRTLAGNTTASTCD